LNNQWVLFSILTLLLLALAEAGYRAGLRLHTTQDGPRRSQIEGVRTAVLGLLALLIGFTFAMGVSRYETRRDLVVKEANAIGTTWLRAGLLPEARRAPVKELLGRYVDVRLKYEALGRDPAILAEGLRLSAEIHDQLWQHAEAATAEAPTLVTVTFITSLNQLIDVGGERIAAKRNQIPTGVWGLLVLVAGFGCFTTGYGSGSQGARSGFTNLLLPVLITVVIMLIFDLTHSRQGLIGVSQQPLIDLQESFKPKP
jgi:hypothetical protein